MGRRVVIVGAGQAGAAFAEKARVLDPDAQITLIGAEPSLPYQRPPLSKKYLTGEMEAARLLLRPASWYADQRIEVRAGQTVTAIERDRQQVRLQDGSARPYDILVLATGGIPRHLPAAMGGELPGVLQMRNLADADALAPHLTPNARFLVIGGGYIGLEAAAVARGLGAKVQLVEAAPRILARVACAETSDFFRELHLSRGVEILEGAALNHLTTSDGMIRAALGDGRMLEADVVLVGIGIEPDTALASAAGLHIEGGIAVNADAQTSDPMIYACGDCTSQMHLGQRIRVESVQNAIDQAQSAALHAFGQPRGPAPVPWFWSDQYEVKLQIAGLNHGYDSTITRPGSKPGGQSIWYFLDDKFCAVDAMNDPKAFMSGKKMLERGISLTPQQAADPDLDLKTLLDA